MYIFNFKNIENTNQYEELIKEFLQPYQYCILHELNSPDELTIEDNESPVFLEYEFSGDKDEVKRKIYSDLSRLTKKSPKWGILTGIRPVKLAGELKNEGIDDRAHLMDYYRLHESKASLTTEILDYQLKTVGKPQRNSLSLYIGIPFCPTRCLYCSFTSNQVSENRIQDYLVSLIKEIRFCGNMVAKTGMTVESVYIGGGTPTTLSDIQLDELLSETTRCFNISETKEFTVEAGRPDTITSTKLRILRGYGVDRISINPQTMKESTLELIERQHSVDDIYRAFNMAGNLGFKSINADLIAGLPEESFTDFANSLNEVISIGASNITLHTLAVKRSSRLKLMDENFNYKDEEVREKMLNYGLDTLKSHGFRPYYLYRQKHTSGNTENIGYCLNDLVSTYNIRIMEEAQSILALGAGGISKIYFPDENRLERVANVSNFEIYMDRIDEMLNRKRKNFFMEEEYAD